MSKADLVEQAKALGVEGVTTKTKVADLERAIAKALKVPVLDVEQAAAHLGISTDELMMSFYRGLPPGKLAINEGQGLRWRRSDLARPRSQAHHSPQAAAPVDSGEGVGDDAT